jgi:erythromycin esterase
VEVGRNSKRRHILLDALLTACIAFGTSSLAAFGQTPAPSASDAIANAYVQLAAAYERADKPAISNLLAPEFEFTYTTGARENLAAYIADWTDTLKNTPGVRVEIRVERLSVHGDTADAAILLTQRYPHSKHGALDVEREDDGWSLRDGRWALTTGRTISDTFYLDGTVASTDAPVVPLTAPQRSAVVAQLKEVAWPIRSAVPGGSAQDLAPLEAAIGPARIVAMGEATHGTSEFFSLKDRIFRLLATRMGFTVFAMETPWVSGLAIDKYITSGQGDARTALSGTFAVWDNQEVLDLIEWMRAYNITRGSRPALRFVGIDMQDDPSALAAVILPFVKAARPADVPLVTSQLACLRSRGGATADCARAVAEVESMVTDEAKGATLPRDDILRAEHAATVAREQAQMWSEPEVIDQVNSRDRSMAANLEWFATTMFPHARIAVWAHDGHVMTSSTSGMIPMGTYLRKRYGENYYVIGFGFDRGSVSPNGVVATVTVPPAPSYSVEPLLRSTGEPLFGLNLRPIPAQTPLGAYLASAVPMRTLGAFSSAADLAESQTFGNLRLADSFDTLIFVDEMHAAHSFEVHHPPVARTITVPAGSGGVTWPTKWIFLSSDTNSYKAGGDAPSAADPAGLLWLSSVSNIGSGYTVGTIPVAKYRGKHVRLTGMLQAAGVDKGAGAWMVVSGAGKVDSFDYMLDRSLQGTTGWTPFTILLDVPQDASAIRFGLLLRGRGQLWATNLEVH